MNYVQVAWDNEQLLEFLKEPEAISSQKNIGEFASDQLIETIKDYIRDN